MKARPPHQTRLPGAISGASFFSGIGGFDLGFERAGIVPVFQCENDAYCAEVLATHWPHVYRREDIADVTRTSVPSAEVWYAGFPCQDLSLADPRGRDGLAG